MTTSHSDFGEYAEYVYSGDSEEGDSEEAYQAQLLESGDFCEITDSHESDDFGKSVNSMLYLVNLMIVVILVILKSLVILGNLVIQ